MFLCNVCKLMFNCFGLILITGNPVSNMFDISLMITLLTNLANLNYYCELSFATDTTPLADLASIQYYRNHISNIKDGKIDNNFFNKAWDDIAEVCTKLNIV